MRYEDILVTLLNANDLQRMSKNDQNTCLETPDTNPNGR